MDKQQTQLGPIGWRVKLHLDSYDDDKELQTESNDNKLQLDEDEFSSSDDTAEVNKFKESKKFNYDKLISMCIKATSAQRISMTKLCRVLHPQYGRITGSKAGEDVFWQKMKIHLKKSTLFKWN